jgi:hypothetical protein
MLVNGMDNPRSKISGSPITLVDTSVEPLNRNMDRAGTVLLHQVSRCLVDVGGHR